MKKNYNFKLNSNYKKIKDMGLKINVKRIKNFESILELILNNKVIISEKYKENNLKFDESTFKKCRKYYKGKQTQKDILLSKLLNRFLNKDFDNEFVEKYDEYTNKYQNYIDLEYEADKIIQKENEQWELNNYL